MSSFKTLGGLAAIFVLAFGGAAQANVNADQVWTAWKNLGQSIGAEVTAENQRESNGVLTLTGVMFQKQFAPTDTAHALLKAGSYVRWKLGSVRLVNRGDGTVEIDLPKTSDFDVKMADLKGGTVDLTSQFIFDGQHMVASGTIDQLKLHQTYKSLSLDGKSTAKNAASGAAEEFRFRSEMSNVEADQVIGSVDKAMLNSSMTAERVTLALDQAGPGKQKIAINSAAEGFKAQSNLVAPIALFAFAQDPKAAFAALANADTTIKTHVTQGKNQTISSSEDASGRAVETRSTSDSNVMDLSLDQGRLDVSGEAKGYRLVMKSAALPLPKAEVSIAQASYGLVAPFTTAGAEQPGQLRLALRGVAPGPGIWAMIDRKGALPHVPANLDFDGALKLSIPFGLDQFAAAGGVTPSPLPQPQLENFELKKFQLDLAGASLSGTGSVKFDNSVEGPPQPIGGFHFFLDGGEKLIGELTSAGIMTAELAQQARVMLALFSRPTAQAGQVESQIEFGPKGEIMLNGQRVH